MSEDLKPPFFPRIRGRVAEMVNNEDEKSLGWIFEITVTMQLGEGEGRPMQFGPYPTEKDARVKLMEAIQLVSEQISKQVTGTPSGAYIDMKTNEFKKWDKSDVH